MVPEEYILPPYTDSYVSTSCISMGRVGGEGVFLVQGKMKHLRHPVFLSAMSGFSLFLLLLQQLNSLRKQEHTQQQFFIQHPTHMRGSIITMAATAKPIGPAPISLSENPNTLYSVTDGAEVVELPKPSSSMIIFSVPMVLDP